MTPANENAIRAAVPGCQTCAECQSVKELKNKQRGIQ